MRYSLEVDCNLRFSTEWGRSGKPGPWLHFNRPHHGSCIHRDQPMLLPLDILKYFPIYVSLSLSLFTPWSLSLSLTLSLFCLFLPHCISMSLSLCPSLYICLSLSIYLSSIAHPLFSLFLACREKNRHKRTFWLTQNVFLMDKMAKTYLLLPLFDKYLNFFL